MTDENQWRARIERRLVEVEAELARYRRREAERPYPVIHVRSMGNIANRMIQYMAALALQARLPAARLAGIDLHEWGIVEPVADIREPACRIATNRIDLDHVASRVLRQGDPDVVLLEYLQHTGNLLPAEFYRTVFGRRPAPAHRFGDDQLVISLRMNEVLSGFYPLYTLLPVEFYRDVVRDTGLEPVFFGQLTPSAYLDSLQAAFPDAPFIAGREPMEDFEVLRSAPNLCLSVSTFAWTAGYLSDAKRVIIPVTGLFSPAACMCINLDHDLVPRGDQRFEHWFFPLNYAVPAAEVADTHAALTARWRKLETADAEARLDGRLRQPRAIDDYRALFDAEHYLRVHKEVADAVAEGRIGSAQDHYTLHGFDENRSCFPLDVGYYARTHPDAADAVGFGLYRDLHHFHARAGAALGYQTSSDQAERLAA